MSVNRRVWSLTALADMVTVFFDEHDTVGRGDKIFMVNIEEAIRAVLLAQYPDSVQVDPGVGRPFWDQVLAALPADMPAGAQPFHWRNVAFVGARTSVGQRANDMRALVAVHLEDLLLHSPRYAELRQKCAHRKAVLAAELSGQSKARSAVSAGNPSAA